MLMAARFRRALFILTPSALGVWAIDRKLSDLEAKYPALPVNVTTCSSALRFPRDWSTQHTPHVDIYSARVRFYDWVRPEWIRPGMRETLQDDEMTRVLINSVHLVEWATVFFNSTLISWEGSIIGCFLGRGFQPGDLGTSNEGFSPISDPALMLPGQNNRRLLHGTLTVERPPKHIDFENLDDYNPYGLLVSWKMPKGPRLFFEKIARWRYPWRLMSGGRHEFTVKGPYFIPGREDEGLFIDFRFASAHDYQIVPDEGDLSRQKTIPKWAARLHRGYARLLLDQAVKEQLELNELLWEAFGSGLNDRLRELREDFEDDNE
ncbi:uncharacterized protein BDV14DRAFT_70660 [Aspergillus stella-maris]|uniref:uncharacterized protein n=1 Tax=Aspergillus stella-maris TaxID=1810926 RepID=UPI003CCE4304